MEIISPSDFSVWLSNKTYTIYSRHLNSVLSCRQRVWHWGTGPSEVIWSECWSYSLVVIHTAALISVLSGQPMPTVWIPLENRAMWSYGGQDEYLHRPFMISLLTAGRTRETEHRVLRVNLFPFLWSGSYQRQEVTWLAGCVFKWSV